MSALLVVRGEDAWVQIWGRREVRRVSQAPACIWKRARGGESSADMGSTTHLWGSRKPSKPSKPKPETTEGEEFVFSKWVLLPCGVRDGELQKTKLPPIQEMEAMQRGELMLLSTPAKLLPINTAWSIKATRRCTPVPTIATCRWAPASKKATWGWDQSPKKTVYGRSHTPTKTLQIRRNGVTVNSNMWDVGLALGGPLCDTHSMSVQALCDPRGQPAARAQGGELRFDVALTRHMGVSLAQPHCAEL
ncbi:hypothetical protein B0H14DRAFT_2562497 [Mycena olivaceomarginata]|nr:hypothetical protein B0H14DRAFT_2562497 [Mycena olivaceomarginata]